MSFMSNAVSAGMAVDSKTHWHDLEQAFIDEAWVNSTQIAEDLKEQPAIGDIATAEAAANWTAVEAWHAPVLEITGVNYYKTEDQATRFMFRDIDKQNINGKYYYWRNNFWLSFFEYDKTTYQSYCVGVRCDNELKYRDPVDHKIYTWPCRVDNFATQSKFRETDYLITPNNNYTITVQRNAFTERVCTLNRRFIFGGGGPNDNKRVFKIIGLQNSHKDVDTNVATLLYINLSLDEVKEQDDFENGIAWNADAYPPTPYTFYRILIDGMPGNSNSTGICEYKKLKQNIETIITIEYTNVTNQIEPQEWRSTVTPLSTTHLKVEAVGEYYEHKYKLTGKVIGKDGATIIISGERLDGAGLPSETFNADIVSMIG